MRRLERVAERPDACQHRLDAHPEGLDELLPRGLVGGVRHGHEDLGGVGAERQRDERMGPVSSEPFDQRRVSDGEVLGVQRRTMTLRGEEPHEVLLGEALVVEPGEEPAAAHVTPGPRVREHRVRRQTRP